MPMRQSLQMTTVSPDPGLLDLPWHIPLAEWPASILAALPRGLSRHVVRFVKLSGRVIAVKEIGETVAYKEYELLRDLKRLTVPSVDPVGVVAGRRAPDGEPLDSVLITKHLAYSMPYRTLFSQYLRPDTATRLIDALAILLVRLHLSGFYWGDVSLSNTLFRRDAGGFAAYLVDAETGDLHEKLTSGQRDYDLEIARVNIIGELMDLEAGGVLDETVDTVEVGETIVQRYSELWTELTESESFTAGESWRVAARIERLNDLGFDVGELTIATTEGGTEVVIEPKVVDAGHHKRRLMRLTGLDVGENQARRLLNDLDTYRAHEDRKDEDEEFVAHDWLTEVFEPATRAVPRDLRGKLEPAELYHEMLEHRWYLSENEGRDVPMPEAVGHYIESVLRHRPDEKAILGVDTATLQAFEDTAAFSVVDTGSVPAFDDAPMLRPVEEPDLVHDEPAATPSEEPEEVPAQETAEREVVVAAGGGAPAGDDEGAEDLAAATVQLEDLEPEDVEPEDVEPEGVPPEGVEPEGPAATELMPAASRTPALGGALPVGEVPAADGHGRTGQEPAEETTSVGKEKQAPPPRVSAVEKVRGWRPGHRA